MVAKDYVVADELTPEATKTIADEVIQTTFVPKKVPALDDLDGQAQALGGALASALLTATEMPLHMLQPVVADLAAQLVALGVRQTDQIDPLAVHAPAWITDGVKQESVKLPEQPVHTDADSFLALTAEAPNVPSRIPKALRAVHR